jgi:AP-1-like factor
MYGGAGYLPYPPPPPYQMQYPPNGEYPTPMTVIPVEVGIEGLYEDHDRRRRKNGSEKVVASHVHSVCIYPIAPGGAGNWYDRR